MKLSIADNFGSFTAQRPYQASLRAMIPMIIPVAMLLSVAGLVSLQEVKNQTAASSAALQIAKLSRQRQSPEDSDPVPEFDRVRLTLARTDLSHAPGMPLESELQFARLLARRMESLQFDVTISVARPEQLPIAERLATAMIDEHPAMSRRIALRLDPESDLHAVEFAILRTRGTGPLREVRR